MPTYNDVRILEAVMLAAVMVCFVHFGHNLGYEYNKDEYEHVSLI